MGSFCSCLCVEDFEEYRNSYDSVYRNCMCLRFLAQRFRHMYSSILQRDDLTAPQALSIPASVSSVGDDSFAGTFRSPPQPLPYDDPRCSPLTRLGEESESPGRVLSDCRTESTSLLAKLSGYNNGVSKKGYLESSLKLSSIEITGGVAYVFPSSEEEDVCPTCLEEYSPENPKIILQCSHHFHLGCIYEWMERSEVCPVCGKVMVFSETI